MTPPLVINIQERVEHYRIPVWDRLIERAGGDYRFEVHGPTNDGRAFGSDQPRDYIHHLPNRIRTIMGQPVGAWIGVHELIEQRKPAVVIVTTNPRYTDSWKLPRTIRRTGGVPVSWSKIQSFSRLPRSLVATVKRRLYPRYAGHIVYGRDAREQLKRLGVPTDRIFVAQNTIDTSMIFEQGDALRERGRQLRIEHGLEEKLIVLFLGKMHEVKRHRDLIDAWPRLGELDADLHLVLAGGGPIENEVREHAMRTDPERITWLGRLDEHMDYPWLATADFNVQCGAVGLSINQSMAFGTPTIIADERGSDTEILVHNETGWRYERGNIDALVECMRLRLIDPEATREVAERAAELMRTEVTIDGMVTGIDGAIRAAMEQRAASTR